MTDTGRTPQDTGKRLYQYYRARQGQLIHYRDAAEDLSVTLQRANAALGRMVKKHPEMGVRREGASGHYVFRADLVGAIPAPNGSKPAKDSDEYFVLVGVTRAGKRVVRGEDGTLYPLGDEL